MLFCVVGEEIQGRQGLEILYAFTESLILTLSGIRTSSPFWCL